MRKAFCEVTDFGRDTIALTDEQSRRVVRVYERGDTMVSVRLGAGLRACLDKRAGVVVRHKDSAEFWVISPRDVASIKRLLAAQGAP